MNKANLLLIDDEPAIRKLLEITLESHDYQLHTAATAKEGLIMAANHPPDLILLDIGLPDSNGHVVLEKLRTWYSNPILVLSAHSEETDIVKALDNGANDYLIKPFRTGELLARIRSALRLHGDSVSNPNFVSDQLSIDFGLRTVNKEGVAIKLTATEYTLLALLAKNQGKVLTHRYILKEIWGPGYENESQYLRVFIAQLRKKIENDPNRPKHIQTESGVGYRFQ